MTDEIPNRGTADARRVILQQVDSHEGGIDDPAAISDVVEDAIRADVAGPSEVFDAFASMFRRGEVYEVEPGHVRRTSGLGDPR